jgi:hypothetical protein
LKRFVPIVVIFLLPLTNAPSRGQEIYDYQVWSAVADTLRSVVAGQRYNLSSNFIVSGSERVTVGSTPIPNEQYEINYRLGVIRINAQVADGATVVVGYRKAPFTLSPVYALREVEISEPGTGDTLTVAPMVTRDEPSFGARNLVFGGTKSISFTVGNNRGTALDQSLQATIEGQLTPTIKVKALLSDNNLPVQAEGNTEELEYLDQVYVEIEGSHAKTALGDFGFQNSISTFSPITRQLKGVSAEAWIDQGRVTFAGAESKGQFRTMQFRGSTGLQGPYELLSPSRNNGELIIAGTERVYLDGRRLARGQNQDYTIDYDAGNITFTPRVVITNDTEIAVDFEVTQQTYDRSTLFTAAESRALPGGIDLHVLFARERDDKTNPKNLTLSEEDQDILREAGDDPTQALTSGVTPTDPGEGDYVLVLADTVAGIGQHFVFDDSTGSFDVSFVDVGLGNGDYGLGGISRRGIRYYEYVGVGMGNYRVGRLLPLPESTSLATARLQRTRGRHLTFDAEWNVSDYDRNLFSHLDDGDNVGDAGQFKLGIRNVPVGLGRVGVAGKLNTLDQQFKSFDRARPAYFYRDWNLENVPLLGRETIQEYEAEFTRGDSLALRYTLGRIDRDDVAGVKREGTLRIGSGADRVLTGRAFDTETDRPRELRTRTYATAGASFGFWGVRPSAVYQRERYLQNARAEPDSGIAYELIRVRLGDRSAKSVNASLEVENRETEEIRDTLTSWTDTRRDRRITAQLAVRGRGNIQGDLQITHQEEVNRILDDKRTTDLARLKGFARSGGVRADVDYEISQTAARTLTRSVVFVGEGNGDYNAQGDLVGKGKGAYTVVFSPTANIVPTNTVNFNVRLAWKNPGARRGLTVGGAGTAPQATGGVWSWIKSNVSLDQTLTVIEESTADEAWKIYLMVPSSLQRDNTTVFGSTTIRQDWTLLDGYPSVSLTFRYERRDEEDNRFEGIHEQRFFGQHLARLSRSLSSLLTMTGEASRELRSRGGEGIDAEAGGAYEVTAQSALAGLGFRLPGGSSIDVDFKFTSQKDVVSTAEQTLLTVRPKATWRIGRVVSVFGSYDLTQTWDQGEAAFKPAVFSHAGDAHRWNLTPTIRLSRYISLVAAYNGRRETVFSGREITDHELKMETRAYF